MQEIWNKDALQELRHIVRKFKTKGVFEDSKRMAICLPI